MLEPRARRTPCGLRLRPPWGSSTPRGCARARHRSRRVTDAPPRILRPEWSPSGFLPRARTSRVFLRDRSGAPADTTCVRTSSISVLMTRQLLDPASRSPPRACAADRCGAPAAHTLPLPPKYGTRAHLLARACHGALLRTSRRAYGVLSRAPWKWHSGETSRARGLHSPRTCDISLRHTESGVRRLCAHCVSAGRRVYRVAERAGPAHKCGMWEQTSAGGAGIYPCFRRGARFAALTGAAWAAMLNTRHRRPSLARVVRVGVRSVLGGVAATTLFRPASGRRCRSAASDARRCCMQ
ncbi:hypothetical protein FB451DRAFT_768118 [Mycena latifolia]|nr:hypothetical protein FB451DRAFT_768118 [Mycena latifolia]